MGALVKQPVLRLAPSDVKGRIGRTALALVILVVIWPVVSFVYRPTYSFLGAAVVNLVGSDITVVPEAQEGGSIAKDTPRMDTVFHFDHKVYGRGGGAIPVSTFYHGYLPTAILLALMYGATAGSFASKKKVLILTLLILHAFLAFRLFMAVAAQLNASTVDGMPVLDLGTWGRKILLNVKDVFWDNLAVSVVVPVVIWGFFAFNKRPDLGSGHALKTERISS
ncbi:MAG: hypothetical protein CMJ89_07985 [Planctomycetes bacterium]|jgi:hypothetical protein|nr:hypothetical protein [Planctomycetota bacterium]